MKKIIITTGDTDGIGMEIACKALGKIGPNKKSLFLFFSNPKSEKKYFKLVDRKFNRVVFSDLYKALEAPLTYKDIIEIKTDLNPALCFEQAALAAHQKRLDGIVTAPLSKTLIQKSGLTDRGHTDILRRICKTEDIFMAFEGSLFSLVLATDHVPLKEVSKKITFDLLKKVVSVAHVHFKKKAPRSYGLLGLNPHAGEISGLGEEESNILIPLLSWAKDQKIPLYGPLIPDVCFQKNELKNNGVYISLYHDQGLIPFKIYHKHLSGCQISLGLPFIRTSVDHGTGKDIFGKALASPESMITSIKTCLKYLKN